MFECCFAFSNNLSRHVLMVNVVLIYDFYKQTLLKDLQYMWYSSYWIMTLPKRRCAFIKHRGYFHYTKKLFKNCIYTYLIQYNYTPLVIIEDWSIAHLGRIFLKEKEEAWNWFSINILCFYLCVRSVLNSPFKTNHKFKTKYLFISHAKKNIYIESQYTYVYLLMTCLCTFVPREFLI